jgi:hypothetical protein
MSFLPNQNIAKQISDLLAKGEKVYSNAIGRVGEVLSVDGPSVILKLKDGRKGVTSFQGNRPVELEKVAGSWVIRDEEMADSLTESSIRAIIKKIILNEITNNQFGTQPIERKKDEDAAKELKKAVGEEATKIPGTGKVVADAPRHRVTLSRNAEDNYDVESVTNESDKKVAKGIKLDDAIELVKKHAKDSEKTYVEKAREKSLNATKAEKPKKEDEKLEDKMEESDEKTQVDIADKNDKKAEEKADKKLAPVNDEVSSQMGGEIVDKIDKIIDRVLKNKTKADAKTPFLKADPDKESPDKLVAKDKGTPELKGKKS